MIKYFLLVSTFKYYTKMPHYACAYTYTHMFECMCIHVYINFVSLLPSSSSTTGYVSWHPDQAVHGKTLLTKMLTCLPTLITKWDDRISNHFFLHDLPLFQFGVVGNISLHMPAMQTSLSYSLISSSILPGTDSSSLHCWSS